MGKPKTLCPINNFQPCKGLPCAFNLGGKIKECAIHSIGYMCQATEVIAAIMGSEAKNHGCNHEPELTDEGVIEL